MLVVDDVAENRDVVGALLAPLGFELAEADNGEEALSLANTLQPDIVLMDIVMPVLDGLKVIRHMRATPLLAKIPVIALSASATPADEQEPLEVGADAFLSKPLMVDELLRHMGQLLNLVWIHRPVDGATHAAVEPAALVPPPANEMLRLRELARAGNMREIRIYADVIAAMDSTYAPFAERLRTLAEGFQSKAILDWVRGYGEQ